MEIFIYRAVPAANFPYSLVSGGESRACGRGYKDSWSLSL